MLRKLIAVSLLPLIVAGCSSQPKEPEFQYSGSGGMAAWDIEPQIYLYHFRNGFKGEDALGFNEQLQHIWSRLGAAQTCSIDFDKPMMISLLVEHFGENRITHELNGIGFHAVQSRKVPQFCDEQRIEEIAQAIDNYRLGLLEP